MNVLKCKKSRPNKRAAFCLENYLFCGGLVVQLKCAGKKTRRQPHFAESRSVNADGVFVYDFAVNGKNSAQSVDKRAGAVAAKSSDFPICGKQRALPLFGINGKNFIKTMLNVGKKYDTVRVVNDQIGTPTYTYDLAGLLVDMAESEKYGYYHATNEGGFISWYDFTCEIFRQAGYTTNVVPVTTAEYGLSKAARPFNSRLDKSKLTENGFTPLPDWQDALSRYLKEIEY